jgi:hypothetical protein
MAAVPIADIAVGEAPAIVSVHLGVVFNLMMELLSDPRRPLPGIRAHRRKCHMVVKFHEPIQLLLVKVPLFPQDSQLLRITDQYLKLKD